MKTTCISVKALYEKFGDKLTYTNINKTGEDEQQYFDLYNSSNEIVCCDGECVQIIKEYENSITFLNVDGEENITFILSKEEFEIATFKH